MTLTFKEACSAVADVFEFCPEAWTSRTAARDAAGGPVSWADASASSWCLWGALMACGLRPMSAQLTPIAKRLGYRDFMLLNDIGGRLLTIKMLRIAAGELAPKAD